MPNAKRTWGDLYDGVKLPVPKWPRVDQPEKWTDHDWDSAAMINSLDLVAPSHHRCFSHPKQLKAKVSQFIQALDLANFDDYYWPGDLLSPPRFNPCLDIEFVTVVIDELGSGQTDGFNDGSPVIWVD